jgi:predicted nucleic acid-binding protein
MIFVDTSFWLALYMRRDANFSVARQLWSQYASGYLITTNHVRGETWTFLRRRETHSFAVGFLDSLAHSSRLQVLFVSGAEEQEALNWLRKRDDREFSFVDATSFAVMRAQGTQQTLAFDGDFAAAGFVELRP